MSSNLGVSVVAGAGATTGESLVGTTGSDFLLSALQPVTEISADNAMPVITNIAGLNCFIIILNSFLIRLQKLFYKT
jgi:hypothetical protein